MTFTINVVGFRWQCSKYIRRIQRSDDWGLIREADIKRIGWFTWYLRLEVERKNG